MIHSCSFTNRSTGVCPAAPEALAIEAEAPAGHSEGEATKSIVRSEAGLGADTPPVTISDARAEPGTSAGRCFSFAETTGGASEAIHLARRHLREAERVAEFTAYERVFALWHVLHIPLIFLLAASAIFHVIAVYMY